jgi:predicted amidohydrolase YtcJ
LIEPYAHRPDWYGIKVWEDDQLKEAYQKVDAAGFQIHTHQIGDAAARYALDALEYVRDLNGARDSRHSFAHIQMMRPDDIQRMANLGMNAITAPYWQVVDDYYWDLYLPYIGPIRADTEQYPMRSLFKAGLNVTIHSDFFVTPPDFAWAFYSAMTRVLPERIADEWYGPGNYYRTTDPNEALNYYDLGVLGPAKERAKLPQVIRAATINGARANFLEKEIGSVEIGKLADLVVLDRNLFKVDVEEIANFEVLMTFFEGDLVYSAN